MIHAAYPTQSDQWGANGWSRSSVATTQRVAAPERDSVDKPTTPIGPALDMATMNQMGQT